MDKGFKEDLDEVRADVELLNAAVIENLLIAEKNIAVIRAIVIAFATLTFFVMPKDVVVFPLAYILLVLIWAYGIFTLYWEPYRKFAILRASWFTYVGDGAFTTLWLYATGGLQSPFFLIFCISIIAVGYRFSTKITLLTAGIYSLAYVGLVLVMGQWNYANEALLLSRVGFFFIIGYFTNLITHETLKQAAAKLQMKQIAEKANLAETDVRALYANLEKQYGERTRELESSVKRFESLIEAIPQMAWTNAPDGHTLYLNKAWYNYTGATDLTGWKWGSYLFSEDKETTMQAWQRALKTGEVFEMEYRWLRYDGEVRWMLGRANPVRDENGVIEFWIGTATDIHEQKQTEEKFKFLSDMMPQLVWTSDPVGFHTYFNQRWIDYTGYTVKQSQGTEMWNNLLHPDDRERASKRWAHSLATGEIYEIEYRFQNKFGVYRWFLGRAMPLKDKSDNIIQWFGTCTDIHDQKAKEAALMAIADISEATRELKDPVQIMDTATRMLCDEMQATRCAYAEVEEDENIFTIVHDYSPTVPSTVGTYPLVAFGPKAVTDLRAGRTLVINDVDRELERHEGADTFNSIHIKAIICCPLIKEGRLVAMMAMHQDIIRYWTDEEIELVEAIVERCWASIERARSEKRLRLLNEELEIRVTERTRELATSEELFRLLAENATDMICRLSADGNYLYISPSSKMLLGLEPAELIGHSWMERVHPDDITYIQAQSRKNFGELGNSTQTLTYRSLHKNGNYIYLESTMRKITDVQGNIIEYHTAARDVTERKAVEETLIRNNQELEQFAYVASHDMKEPLRMISSYTQLMLRKIQTTDDDIAIFSRYISEGVDRMQALITDLLEYSRIGRQEVKFIEVDSNKIIEAVRNSLSILISESGAEVISETLPQVLAIPSLFHQLFQNLIENGIKFRKPDTKPRIEISARQEDNQWLFAVRDNGIGIEAQYAEKVFVIFQRLHTREQYAGTGIGLAVCKKIVEFHGGKIWIDSIPGAGTTFFFTIPLIPSAKA